MVCLFHIYKEFILKVEKFFWQLFWIVSLLILQVIGILWFTNLLGFDLVIKFMKSDLANVYNFTSNFFSIGSGLFYFLSINFVVINIWFPDIYRKHIPLGLYLKFNQETFIFNLETKELQIQAFTLHKLLRKYKLSNADFDDFYSKSLFETGGKFETKNVSSCLKHFALAKCCSYNSTELIELVDYYCNTIRKEFVSSEELLDLILAVLIKLGYKCSKNEFANFQKNILFFYSRKEVLFNLEIPRKIKDDILYWWSIVLPGNKYQLLVDSNQNLNNSFEVTMKIVLNEVLK